MKTIDEIIKRDDYVRLNDALFNRTLKIASKIFAKMGELEINELSVPDCTVRICSRRSNVDTYEYLGIVTKGCEDDVDWCNSLQDSSSYYYTGDFSCWIEKATYKQRLRFLNNARALFDELDRIETEKCDAITSAIEQTNNLIG